MYSFPGSNDFQLSALANHNRSNEDEPYAEDDILAKSNSK